MSDSPFFLDKMTHGFTLHRRRTFCVIDAPLAMCGLYVFNIPAVFSWKKKSHLSCECFNFNKMAISPALSPLVPLKLHHWEKAWPVAGSLKRPGLLFSSCQTRRCFVAFQRPLRCVLLATWMLTCWLACRGEARVIFTLIISGGQLWMSKSLRQCWISLLFF